MIGQIKAKYEIDAAWLIVQPWLETKVRGQEVLRREIEELAPSIDVARLEGRVRRFFERKFAGWITLAGLGWRIPLDGESTSIVGHDHQKRISRRAARLMRTNVVADPSKQTETERRLRDAQIRHAGSLMGMNKAALKEHKAILGVPLAPPRVEAPKKEERKAIMGTTNRQH